MLTLQRNQNMSRFGHVRDKRQYFPASMATAKAVGDMRGGSIVALLWSAFSYTDPGALT